MWGIEVYEDLFLESFFMVWGCVDVLKFVVEFIGMEYIVCIIYCFFFGLVKIVWMLWLCSICVLCELRLSFVSDIVIFVDVWFWVVLELLIWCGLEVGFWLYIFGFGFLKLVCDVCNWFWSYVWVLFYLYLYCWFCVKRNLFV